MSHDLRRPIPSQNEFDSELASFGFLEIMVLLVVGVAVLGGVLTKLTGAAGAVRLWLLDRKALVVDPLVELPGFPDAGLDLPRTLIAVGILGLFLALLIHIIGRRIHGA